MSFQLTTRHRAVLVIAATGATFALLAWLCLRDPTVTFLHNGPSADWIVFPSAPNANTHRSAEMDVVFHRVFTLDEQPQTAQLSVRGCKRVQLLINSSTLDLGVRLNWKERSRTNVAALLHTGTNMITARVFNDNAPPALWLTLVTDRLTLQSDEAWEASFAGSAWRNAALASKARSPGAGNLLAGGESTFESLNVVWPIWAVFGGVALAIWVAGRRWLNRIRSSNGGVVAGPLGREQIVPLIIVATLWMMLFSHNARLLPYKAGFDSVSHIDYIRYIQERGALPLPNEGLQMFQPPLYYGISAGVLWSIGFSATDAGAGAVLRCFAILCGIAHFTLVFLSLRLLFPGQIGRQLIGLILAAFLPMHLYLSYYVTNETLMALLVSGAVYLCLRILKTGMSSWTSFIALGFILGAAVLTKFTAVLAVPVVAAALAGHFMARREPSGAYLKKMGVMLGTVALVSGWHYVRIWTRMGSVVIGGWDPACELNWWQEDGYRSTAFFARLGEGLLRPLFSGTTSFWDGLYSTMWGDGLCSGALGPVFRSPWNYDLVCAGYLLAVLPTVLILTGAAASTVKLIREGGADRFVLLGLAFALCVGLIYLNLKVPYYASVKSFYGLCALVPLCFFGVTGWDILTRGRERLQCVLGVALLVWAMNSFASLWIRGDSAATYFSRGFAFAAEGSIDAAAAEFGRAVEAEPSNAQASRWLAWALVQLGRSDEAVQHAGRAVQLNPADAACRLQLGNFLARLGRTEEAINEAQRAIKLGPEHVDTYRYLWVLLAESGRYDEAINVARDGLAVAPYDPELRCELGVALMRKGDMSAATNQLAYSLLLQPDGPATHLNLGLALVQLGYPAAGLEHLEESVRLAPDLPQPLTELAWVRATYSDVAVRDGQEAVRLAERACSLPAGKNLKSLGSLAAAYAEVGRFSEAILVIEQALSLARSTSDNKSVTLYENMLASFQTGRPYHESSEPRN